MRKSMIVLLALVISAGSGCGREAEKVVLKEGTPEYALAKDLANIIPAVDPGKNKVLVKTGGIEITAAEVVQVLHNNFGSRAGELKKADAAQLKEMFEMAARQIAERKLMLEQAKESGQTVTEEELNSTLGEQYEQFGGEQAFRDALNNQGISFDYVKENIRETMLIDKLLQNVVGDKAVVSEAEIMESYGKDKTASVRHILLLTEGKTDEEKSALHKRMEEILARARAGEDFAGLAKEYSEDPGSKDSGGLYEDFGRGQMVKPFEDASFTVPVGEISDIVETAYGYHIIKVEGRKKETRPLEEVRAEIETQLADVKKQAVIDSFIKGLKEKSGFKTFGL